MNAMFDSVKGKVLAGVAVLLFAAAAFAPQAAFADPVYSGSVEIDGPSPRTIVTVEYGAEWNYGAIPTVTGWSYLMSHSHDHSSTVTAGSSVDSDTKPAGQQSAAQLWIQFFSTYHAYYDIW